MDYTFLGAGTLPPRWWSPYLRYSAPEDPMLVVETGSFGFRAYCTAMEGGRQDGASPRREIRNSVAVEGATSESALLGSVLAGWLGGQLRDGLRRVLTEDVAEPWLATRSAPPEVLDALGGVIFAHQAPTAAPFRARRAVGPSASAEVRARFVATAMEAARAGEDGVFCLLNLLADPADVLAVEFARIAARCLILVEERCDDALPASLDPPSGGVDPSTAGGRGAVRTPGHAPESPKSCLPLVVGGVLILLAVAIIAVYVKR